MKENETTKLVEFTCHASGADSVFLVGTFNDWNAAANEMEKTAKDRWITSLDLAPGHYEFKFVVDGEWCCEVGCEEGGAGCPKCVPNQFGTMNRVIEVE